MSKARKIRIAAWITGSAVLLCVIVWFTRPFFYDNQLSLGRLLNGWHDARYAAFHRLFFEIGMD